MKVFLFGFDEHDQEAIRWHFGENMYIDITSQYQDALALCADMVIVNEECGQDDAIQAIKEYQDKTYDVDDTEYVFINSEDVDIWWREFYSSEE